MYVCIYRKADMWNINELWYFVMTNKSPLRIRYVHTEKRICGTGSKYGIIIGNAKESPLRIIYVHTQLYKPCSAKRDIIHMQKKYR